MSDDMINQTAFAQSDVQVQPASTSPVVQQTPPAKKSFLPVIVGIAVVVVVLLITFVYIGSRQRSTPITRVTPTPQASEAPIETQGIRNEIAPLLQAIGDLNPEVDEHPFPPVNFDLRIRDPSIQ